MKKTSKLEYIDLDRLSLDINNPRFGELYNGSKEEGDLIEYLLYDEAAEEIAAAIVKNDEFYEDKALWVIKGNNNKYIVRDGNRRCAAVKALQSPDKYKLSQPKKEIFQLPVYVYENEDELKSRITEEHSASLFRSWERIAKALQILDLANNGKQDEMSSLDSRPGDFIKLGSFYKAAVKYGGDDFRKQLRRGRGKTGGKTIIYERLFRDAKLCGYKFKNSPNFNIEITDEIIFKSYINALVKYIEINPSIKTSVIDDDKDFIKRLSIFGYKQTPVQSSTSPIPSIPSGPSGPSGPSSPITPTPLPIAIPGTTAPLSIPGPSSNTNFPSAPNNQVPNQQNSGIVTKRVSIKKAPEIKRKKFPPGLKARIDEYFTLDSTAFPNAKIAMARVTYECVLKYVVENTKSGSIVFKNSGHFGPAYSRKPYTNFEEMNKKFIELIKDVGKAQAFRNFEFDKMHQTIHNYNITSKTSDADQIKNNLIVLLEFLLQDESDLLATLETSKIK
nr:hypothetical protein [uncultured Sphingobacterium sp.]